MQCTCLSQIEGKLKTKKMFLPGLTRWSDKNGEQGIGATFQSWGPPVKGKPAGGLIKFAYCPFCGIKQIEERIVLIDGGIDDTGKD
jgi:hypothetical protein